jgi:microcystin-dependent protein
MSYTIKFTDFANNGSIVVEDSAINDETSLTFVGRNVRGYAPSVAENFLKLLENFANNSPPFNPVEGQLWYDTTFGVDDLKVYDGTQWKSAGSIRKSNTEPEGILGDLWVDANNQQLYLYNGATWVLVGPNFSNGLKTGLVPEVEIDSSDIEHVVLKDYINDKVVTIYSSTEFFPKLSIPGFPKIKVGINLSQQGNLKFWGLSEKAEALQIGSNVVLASNFLRRDIANITDFNLTIRNDRGLSVGSESQLKLTVDTGQIGSIYHATPDSAFDVRINKAGNITTIIRVESTSGNVGIGENNLSPSETLDVLGTGRFTDSVVIESTESTIDTETGALRIFGGVNVRKNIIVGEDATINNNLIIGGDVTVTNDITTNQLNAITIVGNLTGNVTGNVTGNINGTAVRLLASTTFNISGDVSSNGFSYDGQSGGLVKTFNTSISQDFINNRVETFENTLIDNLIIFREGEGLRKITRPNFFMGVPVVPVGALFPFAGTTPPQGYLFCDGSEQLRARFPDLFALLGFTYGNPATLVGFGTFKLPDLRGRFPLGRDNMDNGNVIPNGADFGATDIDAGGGSANRVTDSTADILGNSSGIEQIELQVKHLPDHTHNLTGDAGTNYFVSNNSDGIPEDTGSTIGNGPTAPGQSQYLNTTGGVISNDGLNEPFSIMNPYMTLNYIIYAGRIVT